MVNSEEHEFFSKCEESSRILEDWVNLSTFEDHAQWDSLYAGMISKSTLQGTDNQPKSFK